MNAIATTQEKLDLDRLIEQVILDAETTILYNSQGQKVVLISLDEFNLWQDTLYLLSNPNKVEHRNKIINC
jgi:antitoxin YefM